MTKEEVTEFIRLAFKGVTLRSGTGLWEAQAIDDYADAIAQLSNRDKDEKNDWQHITTDVLLKCESSLSFFDADGMRFHLPAFMLAALDGKTNDGVIFHLSHLSDYIKSMYTSLNSDQVTSIIYFLEWCVSQKEYDFDAPQIQRALNEFWSKI